MSVPPPPKRRERKALIYVGELTERILNDPKKHILDPGMAQFYAWALIVVALFSEEERTLFTRVYQTHAQDRAESINQVRELCAKKGHERLCRILDNLIQKDSDHVMADFMMRIIEKETWPTIQREIKKSRFKPEDFVWWEYEDLGP